MTEQEHLDASEPYVWKLEGVDYVFWPLNDPWAEEIIPIRLMMEFIAEHEAAFRQFRKRREWH